MGIFEGLHDSRNLSSVVSLLGALPTPIPATFEVVKGAIVSIAASDGQRVPAEVKQGLNKVLPVFGCHPGLWNEVGLAAAQSTAIVGSTVVGEIHSQASLVVADIEAHFGASNYSGLFMEQAEFRAIVTPSMFDGTLATPTPEMTSLRDAVLDYVYWRVCRQLLSALMNAAKQNRVSAATL